MARDRQSHLYFQRRPAAVPEPAGTEWQERQQRLSRSLAVSPATRGLDFDTYRKLSDRATQNVRACAMVGQVTGRAPAELKRIQAHIEHHEAEGSLRQYVLDHPADTVAALCANTKRSLSIIISALDGPHDAYLQSLKNLLIADLKPTSQGGEYLDLYNAITELMCASYNYLSSCDPDSRTSPITQADLCQQVHARAGHFYDVLQGILAEAGTAAPTGSSSAITEASMRRLREGGGPA